MFTRHIGIDLGTVNVLVHERGRGIVLNEPSIVAISVNDNRIIAFTRWHDEVVYLVLASLNDHAFTHGYVITDWRAAGRWKEIFNSDSIHYGGHNIGNQGAVLESDGQSLRAVLPANAVVVFQRAL